MAQVDYLKRQFDLFGRVLGKIIAMLLGIKTMEEKSAYTITTEILLDKLHLNLNEIICFSNEDFLIALSKIDGFNSTNLEKLAEILLLLANENQISNLLYKKSLCIYEYLEDKDKSYSLVRQQKINMIRKQLR
ncbi:MAG: hypothetical protein QM751_00845 [Paludibacteraceae bacterium]